MRRNALESEATGRAIHRATSRTGLNSDQYRHSAPFDTSRYDRILDLLTHRMGFGSVTQYPIMIEDSDLRGRQRSEQRVDSKG